MTQSYVANYWSHDPSRTLLGGVTSSKSSRWSHREDAEQYLANVIAIHADLPNPLEVQGEVLESSRAPEIIRHCETAQAVGCKCPECGQTVEVPHAS